MPRGSTHVPIKQKIHSFCRINRAQGLDVAGRHYRRKLQANFVWNWDLKFHSANKTQRQIKSIVPSDQGGGHPGNSQESGKLDEIPHRTVKTVDCFHRCQEDAQ